MATAAQLSANQANAKHSTGPVTPDGKARASKNAATLGLFSASAFIRPGERDIFDAFRAAWTARLVPDGPVEEALVTELMHSAWRLRRCALLEENTFESASPDELDRMQASIDRARTTAQRAMQRNLNELRRVQTERQLRRIVPYGQQAQDEFGVASIKSYEEFGELLANRYPKEALLQSPAAEEMAKISERTQSARAPQAGFAERSQFEPRSVPRSAPCPCGSGEKYKRCCGKNAPPVLSRAA